MYTTQTGLALARAEVKQKLQHSFHWFELYLGVLIALIAAAAVGFLIWEYYQKKQRRDRWRTKDNLEANVDGTFLARLLGDVSLSPLISLIPALSSSAHNPACLHLA